MIPQEFDVKLKIKLRLLFRPTERNGPKRD